jgi:dTMP kinase
MAGRFIVFEGIDNETLVQQTRRLAEWLRDEGLTVVVTREPTDGPIGAQIQLVLNDRLEVDELTQAALFAADRMDHLYRAGDGVLQQVARGYSVLCARYLLSAYAHCGETVEYEWLQQINQPCPWPDLMIFVDTSVQSCFDRFVRQAGYDASQGDVQRTRLTALRAKYLEAITECQRRGQEVVVVNGNQPAEAIHRECRELVERLG